MEASVVVHDKLKFVGHNTLPRLRPSGFHSEYNNRSRSTVQLRDRFLSLRPSLFSRAVSKPEIERRWPYSRHCAAKGFQSKQIPRPPPLPANRKLLLRSGRLSLWDSSILFRSEPGRYRSRY